MSVNNLLVKLNDNFDSPVLKPASELPPVRRIRSGMPYVDMVSGGGIPVNRIIEFYGAYSSLKSYTAYKLLGEFQRYDWANRVQSAIATVTYKAKKVKLKKKAADGTPEEYTVMEPDKITLSEGYKPKKPYRMKRAALVDAESTYDREWGRKLGIDNEGLIYIQPQSLSQAVDVTEALLSEADVSVIVFDSMSAVGADSEVDASMTDDQMAANARFWNKALRKFQAAMNRNPENDVTLIVINSAYEKIGFVLGDPESLKNGNQLKFAKSLSLRFIALKEIKSTLDEEDEGLDVDSGEVTPTKKKKGGEEVTVGRHIKVKCMKNKTARPFLEGTFYFSYVDDGLMKAGTVDVETQIVEIACRFGLIKRSGAWYRYGELAQPGLAKFVRHLTEAGILPKLTQEVYAQFHQP